MQLTVPMTRGILWPTYSVRLIQIKKIKKLLK